MNEFINTSNLPDEWHDKMKEEVDHMLDRFEGMSVTLALIILQSATLHIVYKCIDEPYRMKVLESWPACGERTFKLWDEQDKQ
jgi:hypothetical protein